MNFSKKSRKKYYFFQWIARLQVGVWVGRPCTFHTWSQLIHRIESTSFGTKNTFSSFRVSFIKLFFFRWKLRAILVQMNTESRWLYYYYLKKIMEEKTMKSSRKQFNSLSKKKSSNLPSSSGRRLLASPMKWMKIEISFTKKYFLQPQKTYEHFFMNEIQDFTALIPRRMCVGESTRVFFSSVDFRVALFVRPEGSKI